MKTIVNEAKQCPICGKPMPAGALAGLCPACLLAQGAETDAGDAARGHRFEPPRLEEVAKLFPQLEILDLLGAGGMGAVYKARQPALDRIVALKILPSHKAEGANFEERFHREARALARLSHPNIVAVHEFGDAGGLHFFIMEFVDGANLRLLEQGSRLSPREALQIIPQICDALQYAHDQGVVHRDIKPENVLVDRKGRVKIADFGLAKILGQDAASMRLTAEGQVMGTPHYMAPEQIERPLAVDHRADIYSLGVVFYEMLTGELPLGKFSPPSRKVQVDVRFDEVVLRALENDPARRYQHASEVKSKVETIAETPGLAAAAPPSPASERRYLRWGDFSVVVERDGKRQLNWRGTLLALAVTFGILILAFGLLAAITGRSLQDWASTLGWPDMLARMIITVLVVAGGVVAWGVRRVFQRPLAGQVPRTPQGTVILSPERPWLTRHWRKILLICVCVVAWSWFQLLWFQLRWLTPHRKARPEHSPAALVATTDAATGALVAHLPGGGAVELLAVADAGAAPNEWWRPDGRPIPDTLFEITGHFRAQTGKEFVGGFRDLPREVTGPSRLGIDPIAYGGGPCRVVSGGKVLDGGWGLSATFSGAPRTATLSLGFDLGAWQTVSTCATNGRPRSFSTPVNLPDLGVRVHQVTETAGQAVVTLFVGRESEDWNVRVSALDTNGIEHPPWAIPGSTSVDKASVRNYTFRKLPLAQVKEFRVQLESVHWVEFREVALRPRSRVGKSKRPFKAAAFGETKEIEFAELFDFDRGQTGLFPTAMERTDFFRGVQLWPTASWIRDHGFDVVAGTNELHIVDTQVTEVANAKWETPSPVPLNLSGLFETGAYWSLLGSPRRLPGSRVVALPVTYAFQTRDGAMGLFQILSFTEHQPGARLRYKLVEPAHFE